MNPALTAAALLCLASGMAAAETPDSQPSERERYTCTDEAKRFTSWASLAGRLDPEKVQKEFPGVRVVEVLAGDGRTLRGVASRGSSPRKDAVLVIGGNGWSARSYVDAVLPHFARFDTDVYYFDYRGYGMSTPANPTMHAILDDYRDIATWLSSQGHERLYLYGFSFGGLVALAAFPTLAPFQRVVVDSAPSRASDFGFVCSPTYETVDFVPSDCSRLTVMHGTSDWIVPRGMVSELIATASKCGAATDVDASRGHPFQIEWKSSRKQRVAAVMGHLGIKEKP
jgi:pimeloyl-ACP methyl ester carboxylesterase